MQQLHSISFELWLIYLLLCSLVLAVGWQTHTLSGQGCGPAWDVPEVNVLQLWRKVLRATRRSSNGLNCLCCGGWPVHGVLRGTGTQTRALEKHTWKNHHPIKWEEVCVVDQARTAKELLVKEAIHIQMNHPSLNRDEGLELPRCWMAALMNTGGGSNERPVAPTDSCNDSTWWDARLYIMKSIHTSFIFTLKKARAPWSKHRQDKPVFHTS